MLIWFKMAFREAEFIYNLKIQLILLVKKCKFIFNGLAKRPL